MPVTSDVVLCDLARRIAGVAKSMKSVHWFRSILGGLRLVVHQVLESFMPTKIYQEPPAAIVLEDQSVSVMRSAELVKRAQTLGFQLSRAYKVKCLLFELWDDRSTPAWKILGRDAGGMLQQALVRELLLLTFHLIDDAKSASSIVTCHRKCFEPHLQSGPFKKYYMPLYQDLKATAKKVEPLRHFLIAHQDRSWLEGELWKNLANDKNWSTDGSFSFSELGDLLVLFSYYVNLCSLIVGKGAREFEKQYLSIDGATEIKDALVTAEGQTGQTGSKIPCVPP